MEFRSCPSCKASVLEDDVEDCPFCGASMSGKPSAAPAKPAARPATRPSAAGTSRPAAPVKPAPDTPAQRGTPAPKSPAGPGPVRARPEPEEDRPADNSDPFEVDPLANKQATAVAIKPGKGRTIEVKCPMCETIGYSSSKVVGHTVKCCNPQCLVPIFTVKAPRKEEPPAPPPPTPKTPVALYAGIIGAVLA